MNISTVFDHFFNDGRKDGKCFIMEFQSKVINFPYEG